MPRRRDVRLCQVRMSGRKHVVSQDEDTGVSCVVSRTEDKNLENESSVTTHLGFGCGI